MARAHAYADMPGFRTDMRAATFATTAGPTMLWEELDDPIPGADEVVSRYGRAA
jgi:hypothetical protein